ncbi:DUF397 domain-containing protein [Sphaerisporangium sp. NPDC051011]|uniref:DUF397 domain-containing protein n=1 Tax=Sphaerisporangium sp. NPDC051011 TaxID=3155792 RepID=UPI0034017D0B
MALSALIKQPTRLTLLRRPALPGHSTDRCDEASQCGVSGWAPGGLVPGAAVDAGLSGENAAEGVEWAKWSVEGVALRDSKRPHGSALRIPVTEWATFRSII